MALSAPEVAPVAEEHDRGADEASWVERGSRERTDGFNRDVQRQASGEGAQNLQPGNNIMPGYDIPQIGI